MSYLCRTNIFRGSKGAIWLFVLLFFPLILTGQRKELRQAEGAIDNEEFYIAKKHLEKAEPAILEEGKNIQARYYMAKGWVYLALNSDNYGSLEGLKKAEEYFNKVIALGKSAEGKRGLEAIKNTVLTNAVLDREDGDYKNAFQKFYDLSQLYPKDTLYLFAAATTAFQDQTLNEKSIRLFEKLNEMGYKGNQIQYTAKNNLTGLRQTFRDKEERDKQLKSNYFAEPQSERMPSQEGKILRYLAELYIRTDQKDKAVQMLQGLRDDPNDLDFYRDLTFMHKTIGNDDAYLDHLQTLVKEDEKNKATYWLLIGAEMEEREELKMAETYYKKAIDAAPKNSETHLSMAHLLLKKEEEIASKLREFNRTEKKDSLAYEVLENEQKTILHKALPYLEKSYELDPDNMGVLRALYQSHWILKNQKEIEKYGKLLKKVNQSIEQESAS